MKETAKGKAKGKGKDKLRFVSILKKLIQFLNFKFLIFFYYSAADR